MPVLRYLAVLQTASNKPPSSQAPDPRRELRIVANEDTFVYFELMDDGSSPVQHADGQTMRLTVRPTPQVDDEKVFKLDLVPAPDQGPSTWRVTFTADETRRKAPGFDRGFYDVVLIRTNGQRDFVVRTSPFKLLGAP